MAVNANQVFIATSKLGLSKAQARGLLPSWWTSDLEKTPGGAAELALYLSRRLSVDVTALAAGDLSPRGAVRQVAYKHTIQHNPDALAAATYIASSVAQSISSACLRSYKPLPAKPEEWVAMMQSTANGKPPGFDTLLELCWHSGIPVIPLPNLPKAVRKMDGAALRLLNRPAIVLAKKKSSRAWLSFILAHEIGHIALGHLTVESSIVDVSLAEEATYATESSSDKLEREADAFALELLGGNTAKRTIQSWSNRLEPVEIAVAARESGRELNLDAGHLVLRYAFERQRWPQATMALRFLSEDWNPEAALVEAIQAGTNLDLIADDLREWIAAVTGLPPA